MSSHNYRRASRKRPCRICGKPDWCSYTPDERISFCARTTSGADKISRELWGVYFHDKSVSGEKPIACPPETPPQKPELAPLAIRHFAYQKLIALAPATDSNEIINGAKGLRARKILDFENYGSLPRLQTERQRLAKKIRNIINQTFPSYARSRGTGITGLPGFWLDARGEAQLWNDRDYSCPMLLIPFRNEKGLIQACQIRLMGKSVNTGARYVWLSTPEQNGVSSGAPLHFARRAKRGPDDCKTILVTEGALKAETVELFKPEIQVVAAGGVSSAHTEIIEAARGKLLLIAFDSDYHENPNVVKHLARLVRTRLETDARDEYRYKVRILTWNKIYKGFDDALLCGQKIIEMSLLEWIKSLHTDCQSAFLNALNMLRPAL